MGVTVCLPLFGPPRRELEEGSDVKGVQDRKSAADLPERFVWKVHFFDERFCL